MQAWFELTHEVEAVGMGGAQCRLVRLPSAGAIGDQDAWLMEALSVVRDTSNRMLVEASPRG